jgi:hypothetical protein
MPFMAMTDNFSGNWTPRRTDQSGVTIRYAFPDDREALERLATLDSRPLPEGPMLVAEVEGELWAAVSLVGPEALGDPFRRSAELIALLGERARQLRGDAQHPALWRALARVRGRRRAEPSTG